MRPPLPDATTTALDTYLDELARWSAHLNLTAVPREQAWSRHIEQALDLLDVAAPVSGCRVVDIGSGGGVPAVVFAIVRPDIRVTMLEADVRKSGFLVHVAGMLGLRNVEVEFDSRREGRTPSRHARELRPRHLPRHSASGRPVRTGASAAQGRRQPLRAGHRCAVDARGMRGGCRGVRWGRAAGTNQRRPAHREGLDDAGGLSAPGRGSQQAADQLSRRAMAAVATERSFQGNAPAAVSIVFSWPLPAQSTVSPAAAWSTA